MQMENENKHTTNKCWFQIFVSLLQWNWMCGTAHSFTRTSYIISRRILYLCPFSECIPMFKYSLVSIKHRLIGINDAQRWCLNVKTRTNKKKRLSLIWTNIVHSNLRMLLGQRVGIWCLSYRHNPFWFLSSSTWTKKML